MEQDSKKRGCARYACTGAAELLQSGRLCGWGRVSEISHAGCYIETDHPLPIGSDVQLRLTMAGTVLEIGADVVWITPLTGMGMRFKFVPPEEDSKLSAVIEEVTATGNAPAVQQGESPLPSSAATSITRDTAPGILAKIIKQIDDKGVLTRQELMDIVKSNQ